MYTSKVLNVFVFEYYINEKTSTGCARSITLPSVLLMFFFLCSSGSGGVVNIEVYEEESLQQEIAYYVITSLSRQIDVSLTLSVNWVTTY